ncbi:threonine dehydratase [Nocardioides sp. Root1257]|uniref:threonine ammonia-lyase IlvA n=1 Tax=unclassified Nocardioides TaxID=2615069 RepID=UPI000701EA2D|nr:MULTISPECIES: threonine ammonia-lyase IlvA [unclassified Nocardioides]KQW48712.1 threonine dehydratase [Nocardioides sp. Root1257]KRC47887.1 threonine dehydratase [Nocardioides sp. Root224]
MTDPRVDAAAVEAAAELLRPVVRRTELEHSVRLSEIVGAPVLLKRENRQLTRSYKVRGAYHLINGLTDAERARGVVCASAGNHGQGLAWSCARLGVEGRVYVPGNTPRQKRQRILALGEGRVELIVEGSTYDVAGAAALADSQRTGAVYVPPFDDLRTIAGQGTVAVELMDQAILPIHTVVVPLGGGGLIAGIATWLRERHPQVRIVGVEPQGAASMTAALAAGGPVLLPDVDTFVDGAAVGRVGDLTFPIVRDLVDEVVTVEAGAVCTEMLDLYQVEGIIAEPAGALASAAVRDLAGSFPADGAVACIVSGGNNDVSRYGEIVERSLVHQGLRHYFLVSFPQEPGALRHFLDEVLSETEDIVVFDYVKKNNRETGPALVGVELDTAAGLAGLLDRMEASPLTIERVPPGSPLFTFLM